MIFHAFHKQKCTFIAKDKIFCLWQKSFVLDKNHLSRKKNNFVQAEGWSISVTKGICKMLAQGTQPDVYLSIISLPCKVELDRKSRFINGNILVKLVFQDNLSNLSTQAYFPKFMSLLGDCSKFLKKGEMMMIITKSE